MWSEADRPVLQRGQILTIPAIVAAAGDQAARCFLEFFTATICNPNTRDAYARTACDFFTWAHGHRLVLPDIVPLHVEELTGRRAAPTVKQRLTATCILFDWLVTSRFVVVNPAASVRGPKRVVEKGKTPELSADDARTLLNSIVPHEAYAPVRPPRPGPDRRHGPQLRPRLRRRRNERRGLLPERQTLAAPAPAP